MSTGLQQQEANRRVLIVDDDPALVRALSFRCRKLGLETDTAEDGVQAILKAKRNPPRLMILDVNMPQADGMRVCEWVLDPSRPAMDIVLMTGRSDLELLDRCDGFGAYYVPKDADTWPRIKEIIAEVLHLREGDLNAADTVSSRAADAHVVQNDRNRVLIVEDDADLARALECRLQKCGAETFVAHNGIEGYRIAARELPDVVVADYNMPDGGGHYLIWRMKDNEATRGIPVLVITGQNFPPGTEFATEREVTGRTGATRVFYKPLDTNQLFQEVSRHCSIKLPHVTASL